MLPGRNVEFAIDGVLRPGCLVNVSVRQRTFGPRRAVPVRTLAFEIDFVKSFAELFGQDEPTPFDAAPITARADQLRLAKASAALLSCPDCVPELEQVSKEASTDLSAAKSGTLVEVLLFRLGGWVPGLFVSRDDDQVVVRLDDEAATEVHACQQHVRLLEPQVPTFAECSEMIQILDVTMPVEVIDWLKGESNYLSFNKFLFEELWTRTALIWSQVCEEDHPFLRFVGCAKSLDVAEPLIQAHLKKVQELIAFSERRNRRLKLLEERRPIQESAAKTEFFVHDSLVGLVIGKQGENLSRIARTHNVEIRVFPDEVGARRLRIYGNDAGRVHRAREELDFKYLEIPLPPEHAKEFLGWLQKEKQLIRDISHRHNLHSIWIDNAKESITLCGLNRNIQDFLRALAQAHVDSPLASTASRGLSASPSSQPPNSARNENPFAPNELRRNRPPLNPKTHEPIWPYPNAAGSHSTAVVGSRRPLSDRCPPAPYHPSSHDFPNHRSYRGDSGGYPLKPSQSTYGSYHMDGLYLDAGPPYSSGSDGMQEYHQLHSAYNTANCHPNAMMHHQPPHHSSSYHNTNAPLKNMSAHWGRQPGRGRGGGDPPPPPPRNVLTRE